MLVLILENGHTAAEKTMRAAGHIQQLLDGRQLLQTTLEDELEAIVAAATGRPVRTMLSATRLDPDLSAEIFLLEDGGGAPEDSQGLSHAVDAAVARSHELGEETQAVQAEARQARKRTENRRADKR